MKMTMNELQHLTQKQLKEYAKMQKPEIKVPVRWTDKKVALLWIEKNIQTSTVKVAEKPNASFKTKVMIKGSAIKRRQEIVKFLLENPQQETAAIADKFGKTKKSIADDLHAIKHNRNNLQYLKADQKLDFARSGQNKLFFITN